MTDVRAELEVLMRATLSDEQAHRTWTYRAVRPCPVPPVWHPGQFVWGDCSKGVQFLCKWAAAPDPMRNSFGWYGNSQTIWVSLQHLPLRSGLLVGDIVTFGYNGDEHAVMVLEAGSDPLVWSFGHQGAPNTYRLSWDPRPQQYLRLPVIYVPTPEDILRHRTGWFAWVAWRLGEGDWQDFGKTNTKVRPDVPAVIPMEWWKRFAQFLINRKNGNKLGA